MVKELLSSGVGVDERPEETGTAALGLAASGGQLRVVRYLIERGADVNAVSSWNGMTPLMCCLGAMHTKKVYVDVATVLLEAGAWRSLDVKDVNGRTARDWARDGRPVEREELIARFERERLGR